MSRHYRTLFLSDLHLGTRECQAELLHRQLQGLSADHIYLLGDVIDLQALKRRSHWPASHGAVLAQLKHMAQHGSRITYVPGNHDAALRQLTGELSVGVRLVHEACHTNARGERWLLIHGDCFDETMFNARGKPALHTTIYYKLGDLAYTLLLGLNRLHAHWLRMRGLPYWPLAGHLKNRLRTVRKLFTRYQALGLARARAEGYHGIICGHIHQPALAHRDGLLYANCGDWVESCTLLAELPCGELQLLHAGRARAIASQATAQPGRNDQPKPARTG